MTRVFLPDVSVHLIRRGINRCPIFHDDYDRRFFLATFRDAVRDHGVKVHGLALMDTHYHAVATPSTTLALPATMKSLGERYVEYFNQKYGRTGTLWSGRYRAISIETERYWFTCLRYVEQNPVRAGMVTTPGEYRWSTYRVHAFGDRAPCFDWVIEHPLYRGLGSTPEERQAAHRAMCDAPLTEEELELQRHPPRRRSRPKRRPVTIDDDTIQQSL